MGTFEFSLMIMDNVQGFGAPLPLESWSVVPVKQDDFIKKVAEKKVAEKKTAAKTAAEKKKNKPTKTAAKKEQGVRTQDLPWN